MIMGFFVFAMVALLVLAFLTLHLSERGSFSANIQRVRAQAVADAGLEVQLYLLRAFGKPLWEWGLADYLPADCRGGAADRCWATRLNENYRSNVGYIAAGTYSLSEHLVTPPIRVTSPTSCLRFFFQLRVKVANTDPDEDCAYVRLTRNNGVTWTNLTPAFTAYEATLPATSIDTGSCWADNYTTWTEARFDLDAAGVQNRDTIRIGFGFYSGLATSSASLNGPGWYLDDLLVGTTDAVAAAACAGTILWQTDLNAGVGGWQMLIRPHDGVAPAQRYPLTFPPGNPADFASPDSIHWDFIDTTPALLATSSPSGTPRFLLRSTAQLGSMSLAAEAIATVQGSSSPYRVQAQQVKREQ